MIYIIFKNLNRSTPVKEVVTQRIQSVIEKFPALKESRIHVTLGMHNSPFRARQDRFTVSVHVNDGRFQGVRLVKSAQNLYAALADVMEHTLEKLNRFGDRSRVKERSRARNLVARAESSESMSKFDEG
ncbi:MAG: hypothetical protein F9K32_06455 [Desulfobulbaceae bacterium]|nr:MAG: hypothetical protein F9K32_06455 [Desulfobulbaceae bacterium]